MEWVETTGKTVEEAKERVLDQLGVADDDAEFDILEEPRAGLFGLIRGEARVRGRIRPTEVRPKQERRRGRRDKSRSGSDEVGAVGTVDAGDDGGDEDDTDTDTDTESPAPVPTGRGEPGSSGNGRRRDGGRPDRGRGENRGGDDERGEDDREAVEPAAVGEAAVAFIDGLVEAFGMTATSTLVRDGSDLEISVSGSDLGLLIGPGGRTLLSIQDLARVAAQRRLGDHDTRLRIDVAGYRERRRQALERFARTVAEQVIETGTPRKLEPMPSADRKVLHDALSEIDGVASHSEGDDPYRRVVVTPA